MILISGLRSWQELQQFNLVTYLNVESGKLSGVGKKHPKHRHFQVQEQPTPWVRVAGSPLIWVGWHSESIWRSCLEDCVIVFVVAFLSSFHGLNYVS